MQALNQSIHLMVFMWGIKETSVYWKEQIGRSKKFQCLIWCIHEWEPKGCSHLHLLLFVMENPAQRDWTPGCPPEGLALCHFAMLQGTPVPMRPVWRLHCHFMVPSSDLFIESKQRKSMSMTFVVHPSILAHERGGGAADWGWKGQACVHAGTWPLNSNLYGASWGRGQPEAW